MKEYIEPTCQDCIHCEVCDYWEKIAYPNDKDFGGGICVYFNPAADVVPVRHGEWELKSKIYRFMDDVSQEFYVECPFCHRTNYVKFEFEKEKMLNFARENYPYCNCGAKMDGGKI